ncbi:hypothetical protein OJAV_G00012620 [Oryzias javanicus]|uniref:Coiled-coil domain-containing protein 14 n=1 Tax=Oryzias javanicus TaxID=123683 RepID=A0A437DJ19_ORYJA|nr:hypothetical protein OJAV_G00012620 [Oryzias javanicus]
MNVKLKRQEVTSGRLAGTLTVNRQTPAGPPDAAFSLYSTDSEEQVSTLHRGLDRCAVLLDHILQADAAGSPSPPKTRRRTPAGKKKLPGKPGQSPGRSWNHSRPASHTVKGGAARSRTNPSQGKSSTRRPTSRTGEQTGLSSSAPAAAQTCAAGAQSGRRPRPLQRPSQRPPPPPDPQTTAAPLRAKQQLVPAVPHECWEGLGGGEDSVPVRDPGPHRSAADPPRSDEEQGSASCSREELCRRAGGEAPTVRRLLEELKAAVAGPDGEAEHLLSRLEQSLRPPEVRVQPSSPSAERAEVLGLQGELESAQARLQQLQEDLGELRRALQDTQSQLKDVKAENALLKTDLERHRQQLLDGERVNRELAALAQLRLEETEKLQSLLQSAADTPTDRIKGFLRSLSQAEPTPTEHVQERRSPPPGGAFPQSDGENPDLQAGVPQVQAGARRVRSPSLCDSASLWSAWSARSSSTFDTRDEAAFRDGLAALDASIASLQRTFQLDLRR